MSNPYVGPAGGVNPEPAPVLPPEAKPSMWDRIKTAAKANAKRFALWAAAAAAAAIWNHYHGDAGPDLPVPDPPPFIWPENPFGWIRPTDQDHARIMAMVPKFGDTEAGLETKWKDGDNILLYRLYKDGAGHDFGPYQQGPLGCCVSFGSGGAVEMALGVQIALQRHAPQKFDVIAREVIYGGGRVNIPRQGLPSEGMVGAWAAEWLNKYGAVGVGQGSPPVGPYDVQRCREWGGRGVPHAIADLGKDNPVKVSLVNTAADVQNALANGYPVFICSQVGFGQLNGPPLQRDKDGFLRRSGSWPHCMFVAGYRGGARKGFLIVNSWGAGWVAGPKGFGDEPEGSFWCDYATMEVIVRGSSFDPPDSFAVSTVGGFKRRKLDPKDWIVLSPREVDQPVQRVGPELAHFGWISGAQR